MKPGFKTGIISGSYGNIRGNPPKGVIGDFIVRGDYATNYGIGETTLRRALVSKSAATGSAAQQLGFDGEVLHDDVGTLSEGDTGGIGATVDVPTGREAPKSVSKVLYSRRGERAGAQAVEDQAKQIMGRLSRIYPSPVSLESHFCITSSVD